MQGWVTVVMFLGANVLPLRLHQSACIMTGTTRSIEGGRTPCQHSNPIKQDTGITARHNDVYESYLLPAEWVGDGRTCYHCERYRDRFGHGMRCLKLGPLPPPPQTSAPGHPPDRYRDICARPPSPIDSFSVV